MGFRPHHVLEPHGLNPTDMVCGHSVIVPKLFPLSNQLHYSLLLRTSMSPATVQLLNYTLLCQNVVHDAHVHKSAQHSR